MIHADAEERVHVARLAHSYITRSQHRLRRQAEKSIALTDETLP